MHVLQDTIRYNVYLIFKMVGTICGTINSPFWPDINFIFASHITYLKEEEQSFVKKFTSSSQGSLSHPAPSKKLLWLHIFKIILRISFFCGRNYFCWLLIFPLSFLSKTGTRQYYPHCFLHTFLRRKNFD